MFDRAVNKLPLTNVFKALYEKAKNVPNFDLDFIKGIH